VATPGVSTRWHFVIEESEQRPLTWLAPLATLSPRERAGGLDLCPLPWGEGARGTRAGEGAFGPCCFHAMAAALPAPDSHLSHSIATENRMPETPMVTAVIPTRNRPQLVTRAVRTALNQTYPCMEVVAVVDGPDELTTAALAAISDERLRVIKLPRPVGSASARNLGVEAAQGKWIAFLDDDDEWLPEKTELQMRLAANSALRYPIVSSKLFARTSSYELVWPRKLPRAPLSEYLLARDGWSYGEGLLSTITLLFPKELYRLAQFQPGLRRHQDLDWVLRASRQDGAGIEFLPEPLAIWHQAEKRSSISTTLNWRTSFEWIESVRGMITPRAYASFVATNVAPQAARQRDWGAFAFLPRMILTRGKPTARDVALFMGMWFAPRRMRHAFRKEGR